MEYHTNLVAQLLKQIKKLCSNNPQTVLVLGDLAWPEVAEKSRLVNQKSKHAKDLVNTQDNSQVVLDKMLSSK